MSVPAPPELSSPLGNTPPKANGNVSVAAIRIPSIGLDSKDFTPGGVGLDSHGIMQVPPLSHPKQIAWYRLSPLPGDAGPATITSHVNGDGMPGGFAKLSSVKVGATVAVDRTDGRTATFRVSKTITFPKSDYARHRAEIFGDMDHGGLRLITCGGTLGPPPEYYESQVVVFADVVSVKATE
ncbi:MAG: hypothetical protein JWO67_6474 [Streptosporangiaceae bacterium]|nr:hypothetical protein [Streptosporangiaceae bacterium]